MPVNLWHHYTAQIEIEKSRFVYSLSPAMGSFYEEESEMLAGFVAWAV